MAGDYQDRMIRVLDHIYDNPAGDLSVTALAEVAAMSPHHWHRVFRSMTGAPLAQTVRRARLHRASVALAQGQDDITAIARSVGYADTAAFTRAFTRAFADAYGMPPGAFRARDDLRPLPKHLPEGPRPMHPVEIRSLPARHLAAMPHTGPYPEISRAYQKLTALMRARGLAPRMGTMVAIFWDDPSEVPAADLRSHAAFECDPATPVDPPAERITLPAGRVAVLTYRGPYAGLPAAYDQLYAGWLPSSGEEPADRAAYEVYLNSPMDTAPEDLLTELHLPLGDRAGA